MLYGISCQHILFSTTHSPLLKNGLDFPICHMLHPDLKERWTIEELIRWFEESETSQGVMKDLQET